LFLFVLQPDPLLLRPVSQPAPLHASSADGVASPFRGLQVLVPLLFLPTLLYRAGNSAPTAAPSASRFFLASSSSPVDL
jgi:hypothetical protein